MLDNNQFNTEPYYDDFDEDKKFYKIRIEARFTEI